MSNKSAFSFIRLDLLLLLLLLSFLYAVDAFYNDEIVFSILWWSLFLFTKIGYIYQPEWMNYFCVIKQWWEFFHLWVLLCRSTHVFFMFCGDVFEPCRFLNSSCKSFSPVSLLSWYVVFFFNVFYNPFIVIILGNVIGLSPQFFPTKKIRNYKTNSSYEGS